MLKSVQLLVLLSICSIQIPRIDSKGNYYTSFKKNVYYIDNNREYTWFNSLSICNSMKMSLVTIDTKTKSDEITILLKNNFNPINPLWIGAIAYNGKKRQHVWISNGQPISYSNWHRGEPNFKRKNEYCVQTGWSKHLQWNDGVCSKSYGFICEFNHSIKEMQRNLDNAIAKIQQLQKEGETNKALLQEELKKVKQFEEILKNNKKELQLKEQQLQEYINITESFLEWFSESENSKGNNTIF